MNRIYLDDDRTIDAEISSDASVQADETYFKQSKTNVKQLSTQFSLYVEELKKDLTRALSAIAKDFHHRISHFMDEEVYGEPNSRQDMINLLQNWKNKLDLFQSKFSQLKISLPFLQPEKHRDKPVSIRKIKFVDILQKFIYKLTEEHRSEMSLQQSLDHGLSHCQQLYQHGRFEQAILRAQQTIQSSTNFPQLHFLIGNCYKSMSCFEEAIQEYSKAIKMKPKGCYYNNRGNCYLGLQDIIKAEHDYKQAIKQEPNNEVFLGNYGNVCLSLKKYQQAIISYSLALRAGSPNDFYYNNRAFAEIKLRRLDDAIQSYNQAISISPGNHVYLKNRANLHMEKGNIEQALCDIQEAIEIEPRKHEYYFLKGKWEYLSKQLNEALISFRKAYQLDPTKKAYKQYYLAIQKQLTYR